MKMLSYRSSGQGPVVVRQNRCFVESLETRAMLSFSFQFDYRYDTAGFFTTARRDVLTAAAESVSKRIGDAFAGITPSGSDTWTVNLRDPTSGQQTSITNPSIPQDKIVVFVGARDLEGTTLGQGGPTGWSASGTAAWTTLVRGRGQSGATASPRTDFAPKTGAISFDNNTPWFFSKTTTGLGSTQSDFFSVAAHELGHVLGIGTGSETWPALASGGYFHGPKASAVYGGSVPLMADGQHFKDGIQSGGSEVALDPTLKRGVRKLYTPLDFAALDDIGYDIYSAATVTGSVFTDKDADGYRDSGEAGISGVRVFIDADKSGVLDVGEINALTNSDGRYSFGNLNPGTYRVRDVLPTGYVTFKPSTGYRDVSVGTGQTKSSQDFSIGRATTASGRVTGTLFNDADGDGVKDSGETGFSGWRVFIDKDKDGILDAGEASTTTDGSGNYTLPVIPGAFRLAAESHSGYRITIPSAGYFDLTVSNGQTVSGKSFGFTTTTLISGYVFKDADADGLKDSNEVGLGGWRIYLDGTNGKYDVGEPTAITDSAGNWTIKGLLAGTYTVRIDPHVGYTTQAPTNAKYAFTLTSGQTKTGLRFAEKPV